MRCPGIRAVLGMASKKTQRVTLDLGESSAQRIGRLQESLEERTIVEVIRQALRLLEFVVKQARAGKEFLLRDSRTGELERVTLLELVSVGPGTEGDEEAEASA